MGRDRRIDMRTPNAELTEKISNKISHWDQASVIDLLYNNPSPELIEAVRGRFAISYFLQCLITEVSKSL
jgi:hypothetical protein